MINIEVGKEYLLKEVIKELLDEKLGKGGTLNKQIKRLKTMIDYEDLPTASRKPRRILITSIYSFEEKEIFKKYEKYVRPMILYKLHKGEGSIVITTNTLMVELGMGNKNLLNHDSIKTISKDLDAHPSHIRFLVNNLESSIKNILLDELKRMESNYLIRISKRSKINFKAITQSGNEYFYNEFATEEQENIILKSKRKSIQQINEDRDKDKYVDDINNEKDIKDLGTRFKFYRLINMNAKQDMEESIRETYKIDEDDIVIFERCYDTNNIQSHDDIIKSELNLTEYKKLRKEFNSSILNYIDNNIDKVQIGTDKTLRLINMMKEYDSNYSSFKEGFEDNEYNEIEVIDGFKQSGNKLKDKYYKIK